ncbi:MAG TPA: ATP-binding protein [Candidatus Acidoferrales bacterium]|nr:ATP-binding protein [Candidatus Acidoferrales bacterium]
MTLRLKAYVALTAAVATALLATHVSGAVEQRWPHILAWLVICLVSETMWSKSISGDATWSLAATAGLSSVALWGPEAGMWISGLSTIVADLFVQHKPAVRAAFNGSQIVITSWLSALVFAALGGRAALPIASGPATLDRALSTSLVMPFAAMIVVYFGLNRAMVSLAVAWSSGTESPRSWWRVLREDWLYMAKLEVDAASFLLVPLMVISFTAVGYPGVLLFYAPLFMLFQSDRRFNELQRAHEENVRMATMAVKGEIAASIGHDLNNALVGITGPAQLILRALGRKNYDDLERHTNKILEQSKVVAEFAKGLSDYTRKEVHVEPMDLNGLLMTTIEFIKGDKRFRAVEWEIELDPALPEFKADVGQIQSVFLNLFVNAADAMGTQQSRRAIQVRTRLDSPGGSARVDIADSGPGIRPEHLPRMFEFMFTTKPKGHGFGLSNSQRAIANHGGQISVQSVPGEGAHFTILLPVRGRGPLS